MPSSANITSFNFEAVIHNPDDTLATEGKFGVEYYNTLNDGWECIVEPDLLEAGTLDKLLDTDNPPAAVAECVPTFLSAVQAGAMPSVRVFRETTATGALPEVLSEGGKLKKGASSSEGSVDFGDIMLLAEHQIEQVDEDGDSQLDKVIVAVPRPKPNNKLKKALKAAIKHADLVDLYTVEQIEDFFTMLADGSFEDLVGQVATLSQTVVAKDAEIVDKDATIATQVTDIATKDATIATQVTDIATKDATIATQVTDIVTKDATIATQVTDIADKDAMIATQVTDIAGKEATIGVQATDIADRDVTIATYAADIVDKDATIAVHVADISAKSTTIETKEAKIIEQETAMADAAGVHEAAQAELAGKKGDLVVCETTVLEKEAEISAQECTIANRDTDIMLKAADIEAKATKLLEHEATIAGHTEELADRDSTIVALEADKGDLQAQVDSLSGPALPVKDVYTNIVDELQSAADILEVSSNRYSLANLSLDLKTTVIQGPEGELLLQLVDNDSAKKVIGEAVSSLTFDVGEGGGTTAVGANIAPQVTGLTETAVRFKLNSLGLKLDAIYHPIDEDDARVVGQSFKQTPAPGEDISAEGTVTVIFAKKQDTQN
jgi:alpha-acetolactate decarboxylase